MDFKCDYEDDQDLDRYLKYIAPITYNESVKKDLFTNNTPISAKLFANGIHFYMKLEMSVYFLFDSIKSYEVYFIKTDQLELLYKELF